MDRVYVSDRWGRHFGLLMHRKCEVLVQGAMVHFGDYDSS